MITKTILLFDFENFYLLKISSERIEFRYVENSWESNIISKSSRLALNEHVKRETGANPAVLIRRLQLIGGRISCFAI